MVDEAPRLCFTCHPGEDGWAGVLARQQLGRHSESRGRIATSTSDGAGGTSDCPGTGSADLTGCTGRRSEHGVTGGSANSPRGSRSHALGAVAAAVAAAVSGPHSVNAETPAAVPVSVRRSSKFSPSRPSMVGLAGPVTPSNFCSPGIAVAFNFVQTFSGETAHTRLLTHLQAVSKRPDSIRAPAGPSESDDVVGLLRQSGVVGYAKDMTKWDWNAIAQLINAFVRDPRRLTQVLGTKFFKRLLRFFAPRNDSGLGTYPWKSDHLPLARLGFLTLSVVLTNPLARQQHLVGHTLPLELAAMLSQELTDGHAGSSIARNSSSNELSTSVAPPRGNFSTNVALFHCSMVDPLPLLHVRSSSDPPVDRRRKAQRRSTHDTESQVGVATTQTGSEVTQDSDSVASKGSPAMASIPSNSPCSQSSSWGGGARAAPNASASLSRERGRTRRGLVREYAGFIGLMSASHEGVDVLSQARIYRHIKSLCALPAKDQMSWNLLPQLHYGFEANRQVLDEAFRVGSPMLQLNIVRLLALMLGSRSVAAGSPTGVVFEVGVAHPQRGRAKSGGQAGFQRHGSFHATGSRQGMSRVGSQQSLPRTHSSASMFAPSSQDRSRCESLENLAATPPVTPREAVTTATSPTPGLAAASYTSPVAPPTVTTTSTTTAGSGGPQPGPPAQSGPTEPTADSRNVVEDGERWRWVIGLLAAAMLHNEQRVSVTAAEALEEACVTELAVASALVPHWPTEIAQQARWPASLRSLLVQTEAGFEALRRSGWLDRDQNQWFGRDHLGYVDVVSTMLRRSLGPSVSSTLPLEEADNTSFASPSTTSPSGLGGAGGLGITVPVASTTAGPQEQGGPRHTWLCNVPWRPVLRIMRGSGICEEVLLDAAVERAVPYEVLLELDCDLRGPNSSLAVSGALSELCVTASCDLSLGHCTIASLQATLDIGEVPVEDSLTSFDPGRDWSLASRVVLPEKDGVSTYALRQMPSGAVWTFIRGSGTIEEAATTEGGEGALPPVACRLTSISWPLRLLEGGGSSVGLGAIPGGGAAGVGSVVPPPHFCAHLARTLPGAKFLRRTGFVQDRLQKVLASVRLVDEEVRPRCPSLDERGPVVEEMTQPSALEVRAALWAAGHLGRFPFGLELLEDHGVLRLILDVASRARRWSLRGTALYCLALLWTSPLAAEALEELGWDPVACRLRADSTIRGSVYPSGGGGGPGRSAIAAEGPRLSLGTVDTGFADMATTSMGTTTGRRRGLVGGIDAWDESTERAWRSVVVSGPDAPAYAAFGAAHRKALSELRSLHNTVVRRKACDTLTELRRKDASIFRSVPLWVRTASYIAGNYRQPLQVRRFIADLFEETLRSAEALRCLDAVAA
eukprot:TRINITY_DN25016_c0_g4_i1.p1 TRINITY_DN25016_c0_g4~~TRINITY_DN25016_c0_g4_i1.p1  ORF type:complete len:1512 (-),score=273.76 TRINITY_DN25016_c0_g4_i1:72-4169(-)